MFKTKVQILTSLAWVDFVVDFCFVTPPCFQQGFLGQITDIYIRKFTKVNGTSFGENRQKAFHEVSFHFCFRCFRIVLKQQTSLCNFNECRIFSPNSNRSQRQLLRVPWKNKDMNHFSGSQEHSRKNEKSSTSCSKLVCFLVAEIMNVD